MKVLNYVSLFIVSFILYSCAGLKQEEKVRDSEKPAASSIVASESLTGNEWELTLMEARKERKVVIYDTVGPPVRKALMESFTRRTGVGMEFVSGRGAEVSQKLLSEKRAGLSIADAYIGGATTLISVLKPANLLSPLPPLLFLLEVVDTNLWYKKTLPWVDKEEKFILCTAGTPSGFQDYIFHKEYVKEEEITSYYDLLNPKWKGKMSLQDPTTAGKGNTWFHAALVWDGMNLDFMKALAKQDPVLTRDNRQQLEWVVRGKHLIAIAGDQTLFSEWRELGVPLVGKTVKEHKLRMSQHSANMVVLDKAPHPAAAKLFLNWYLGKEGQLAFATSYPSQSYRDDVPSDHLRPIEKRDPNIDYHIDKESDLLQKAEMIQIAKGVFGSLVQ